jgi:hypothetical protein
MISKPLSIATVIAASLLISATTGVLAHAQQSPFPAAWVEHANRILNSKLGKYLSSSGLNALNIISGNIQPVNTVGAAGPGLHHQGVANRSGVMVNDPAHDIFADEDISSQSETNVAGFGKTVLVAYNDSTGLAFAGPPLSGQAYSISTDGGLSFTEIGDFPVQPTGFNFGDPGLAVDRNGVFYQSHIASDLNLDPNFSQVIGLGKSTNGGASFGAPIYTPPPPGANTTILFAFADKPFITTDTSSAGPNAGTVYLTYTSFEFSSSNVSLA